MKRKTVLLILVIVVLSIAIFGIHSSFRVHAQEDDVLLSEKYDLKAGAELPEKVYASYIEAVHQGNIENIKKFTFSNSHFLWEKNAKQMLAMTKGTLPVTLALISKTPEKQFQYNYMKMKMTGTGPKGAKMAGEVKMIVEDGRWKVYQETWRQTP